MRAPFYLLALPLGWNFNASPIAPPVRFVDTPPALAAPEPDAELWIEVPSDPSQEGTEKHGDQDQRRVKRK